MIDIDMLKDDDRGRTMIFHRHDGGTEVGALSSWNDKYVFCRFSSGSTAAACDPAQLTFAHPTQPEAVTHYQWIIEQKVRS